jgi:uncharacterized protein with NRDE domain
LLCQDLLTCSSAAAAAEVLTEHRSRYNPFTLVFADDHRAFVAYNNLAIVIEPLAAGLHVFSSAAEVDLRSVKADRAHRLFAELAHDEIQKRALEPQQLLKPLQKILADHSLNDSSADPGDAICVHREGSGTVSSSVIFYAKANDRFETFHCLGAPCQNSFGASLQLPIR